MKKARILIAISLLGLAVFMVNAQDRGGFSGPNGDRRGGGWTGEQRVVTVQQALTFRDDTPVILQGYIIRALGNEKYLFRDDTGTIVVEIERNKWRGLSVGPNDRVEISGEVDRDRRGVEIEVDRIRRL